MALAPFLQQIDDLIVRTKDVESRGQPKTFIPPRGFMDGFGGPVATPKTTIEYDASELREVMMDHFILIRAVIVDEKHPLMVQAEGLQRSYLQPDGLKAVLGALNSLRRALERGTIQLPKETKRVGMAEIDLDPVAVVRQVVRRFRAVAKNFERRYGDRNTIIIADEYDVQDLLHGLLLVHFNDVRKEEPVPSTAGGSARCDIMVKRHKLFIEAKMTRTSMTEKRLREQIANDLIYYPSHQHCETIVFVVHDPSGMVLNPDSFRDLEERSKIPALILFT